MHKVFQTNIHTENINGNCMRASLASVFEMNVDDLPRFEAMNKDHWKMNFIAWLAGKGFLLKETHTPPNSDEYYITLGMSERNVLHCVVSQSNKMVHDPHPSQTGVVSAKHHWVFIPI
jgi:hypothetical protein